MLVRFFSLLGGFALFALLPLACAKGPASGGPGSYHGVATGKDEIGILEVLVTEADQGPLPATGTLKFPSKTLSLTGTLDKSQTLFSLASTDGYKLVALSRPAYAIGSYTSDTGEDAGSFALLLVTADNPVDLYCGRIVDTSGEAPVSQPFAITATSGGQAVCVGHGFAYVGSLSSHHALDCAFGSAVFEGNVDFKSGNMWGTGTNYGTWSVTPCTSIEASSDGGAPDASDDDAETDAVGAEE